MTKTPETEQKPLLSIRNLTTAFATRHGDFNAVDDVSLDLFAGKTLCLVGESGSGKSVLSRTLLRIEQPGLIRSGQIILHPSESDARRVRPGTIDLATLDVKGKTIRAIRGRDIAMIFQEPMSSLSPVHRIGSQITESIRLHEKISKADARDKAIDLLRQVEIAAPEVAIDKYPFEFSGGMRQRAMIALALACNPEILVADEPTTALDVTIQAEILDLLKDLQLRHQMAMLFITHDMGVVAQIADQVAVMRHGKVIEENDVFTLFREPQHSYTKTLLKAAQSSDTPSARRTAMRERRPIGQPILRTVGLGKKFPLSSKGIFKKEVTWLHAVKNVSFDLHAGENIGIVGESGSGKTTLARCVQRILSAQDGQILLKDDHGDETDLVGLDDKALTQHWRDMRMIFQDPFASLNPRMTISQIIAEPLLLSGMTSPQARKKRVEELLDLVGLPRSAGERYPHAFSGGQRQRVSIARAIAPNPRIIIADEATSALDVSIRSRIMDLLLDLQEQLDLSYLFISHDVGLVRYFCDRVLVMYKGEVVEFGETEQVCTAPHHRYTQSLLSAVPIADPTRRDDKTRFRYHAPA